MIFVFLVTLLYNIGRYIWYIGRYIIDLSFFDLGHNDIQWLYRISFLVVFFLILSAHILLLNIQEDISAYKMAQELSLSTIQSFSIIKIIMFEAINRLSNPLMICKWERRLGIMCLLSMCYVGLYNLWMCFHINICFRHVCLPSDITSNIYLIWYIG